MKFEHPRRPVAWLRRVSALALLPALPAAVACDDPRGEPPSGSLGASHEDSGQRQADATLTSDTGAKIDASLTVDAATDLDGSRNSSLSLDDGDAEETAEGGCTLAAATVDDAGGCGSETITFQLYAASGDWVCTSGDSPLPAFNWLTIFCPAGNQLYLSPTGLTGGADCADCMGGFFSAPVGSFWAALGDAGTVTQTWNGVFYAVGVGCPGLIQEPPPVLEGACLMPGCAPPGRYIARMCACAPAAFSPLSSTCSETTCIEVPFDYPSTSVVFGSL